MVNRTMINTLRVILLCSVLVGGAIQTSQDSVSAGTRDSTFLLLSEPTIEDTVQTEATVESALPVQVKEEVNQMQEMEPPPANFVNQSVNRFPLLLEDAKTCFSEALVADRHGDTLEVVYLIDKIVDLLTEAEQLGEMSEEDHEEFHRFENTLMYAYDNFFTTINSLETPLAVQSLKEQLLVYFEPLEFEINGSKYQVIDDREGHIPLVINNRVEQAIKFFQTKGKKSFNLWISRLPKYEVQIIDIMKKNDLPVELIYLAMVESGMNPKAYSRAHAAGMWQFVLATGKKYGLKRDWWVDERRDPEKSTLAAVKFLKDLYIEFDDWYLAMAAYNSGPGRVNRAIRLHQTRDFWRLHALPKETRNYVPTFLAAAIISLNPEEYGFKKPNGSPMEMDEVTIPDGADLTVLAQCSGISVDELRNYNPELRQFATPVDKPYQLNLPKGKKEIFNERFMSLPEDEQFSPQFLIHKVKRGETLSYLSKKYGVSIHEIASVNKIRNKHRLRIEQKLTIPVPGVSRSTIIASSENKGKEKSVYKVRKGDTLSHIALRYRTSARRIRQLNGLRYGQFIFPGQELIVFVDSSSGNTGDNKVVYTVKKNDTLGHIAMRHGTTVSKIQKWNGMSRGQFIYPGQKLVIYN
tara:strand:+ start:3559 stop:5466 length:1908 start_codon:yes stop_codon:yes gene_type:complete